MNTISKFNFESNENEFVALIGKIGSGKSTLLQGIMGMMNITEGEVMKNGSLGYIP